MKKKIFGTALALIALAAIVSPQAAFAQDDGVGASDPKDAGFQLVSCSGVDDPRTKKTEVECDYAQLIYTATRVFQFVLFLLAPIVLAMIVYTGFTYMTANGDAKKVADAKRMFVPIIIGIFFMFAGYLIVYKLILGNLLDENLGDPEGDIKKSDIIRIGG